VQLNIFQEEISFSKGFVYLDKIEYSVWVLRRSNMGVAFFLVDPKSGLARGPFPEWNILHLFLKANSRVVSGSALGPWDKGFENIYCFGESSKIPFDFTGADLVELSNLPPSLTLYPWTKDGLKDGFYESTLLAPEIQSECIELLKDRKIGWLGSTIYWARLNEARNFHKKTSILLCSEFKEGSQFAVVDRASDFLGMFE